MTNSGIVQTGRVLHVQTGKVRSHTDDKGREWKTAIFKDAVTTPIRITARGLDGDERTGYDDDRALCCQSVDNYRFWRAYFGRDFPLGTFGENVVLDGFSDDSICIGDIVRCGTAVLQITQPRTPCATQAMKVGVPTFVKLVEQTHRRGFLLRVLEPGVFSVGDAFEVIERPRPDAPVIYVNRLFFDTLDADTLRWLLGLTALAHSWRAEAEAKLAALVAAG